MSEMKYGNGSVYRQKNSPFFSISYYRNGIQIRRSAKTTDEREARRLLKRKLAEVETGIHPAVKNDRIRLQELADDLMKDYELNGKSSLRGVEAQWRLHLRPFFGGQTRAAQITTPRLIAYMQHRKAESAADATINNEMATLQRMFNYARQFSCKLTNSPAFPSDFKANNVREGFVEDEEFYRLIEGAESWFYTMVSLGRSYGWRYEELIGMRVRQVNLVAREVRLFYGTTKNRESRVAPMIGRIELLLSAAIAGKGPDDHVFTRHDGSPVLVIRDVWEAACCRAGLGAMYCRACNMKNGNSTKSYRPELLPPALIADDDGKSLCQQCHRRLTKDERTYRGLIFHDLRRTAVRNLSQEGHADRVIMEVVGMKTRSIFDRYRIVNMHEMRQAMIALDERDKRFHAGENKHKTSILDRSRGSSHPDVQ